MTAIARLNRLLQTVSGFWLSSAALTIALLALAGPLGERTILLLAALSMFASLFFPGTGSAQSNLRRLACLWLVGLCALLIWHLIADHHQYHYVWLYGGAELPIQHRIANLWGGDEGTLLLFATILGIISVVIQQRGDWSATGLAILTGAFALAASWWSPFALQDLNASAARPGMNLHLQTLWMLFHPPLVLCAYAAILVPFGAALQAMAYREGPWRSLANSFGRWAWVTLTAGLAAGMAWAYEDASFGQFWHWDPVQTAVFCVWALLTAQQHGLRQFDLRHSPLSLPLFSALGAVAVMGALFVTRNAWLASSHRYVGATSQWFVATVGLLMLMAIAWAGWKGWSHRPSQPAKRGAASLAVLRVARWLFLLVAVLAAAQLAIAFTGAVLEWPRPSSLKPFFETLSRWSPPQALASLRSAYNQWDIDNFQTNRWLAPIAWTLLIVLGYAFSGTGRYRRLAFTTLAVVISTLAAYAGFPLESLYHGDGMTSQHTIALFFWLNALLCASAFPLIMSLIWIIETPNTTILWRYRLPIGLIHSGVSIAMAAALLASVLDRYTQKTLTYSAPPSASSSNTIDFAQHYSLQLSEFQHRPLARGYQALAQVELFERRGDTLHPIGSGNTLFADQRAQYEGPGAVRQLCEILDYRYARFTGSGDYRLDPFIKRGWTRDVQVWIPAPPFAPDGNSLPRDLVIVIKTYPFLSCLWIGLGLIVTGALLRVVAH